MTRRIKRSEHFELSLQVNDDFIRPPRDAQRNWLLNRAMKEASDELVHLDMLAKSFVSGSDARGSMDRAQGALRDDEIMEDWQIPIMREMARSVCASQGDVLEVGFGRGIASSFVQEFGSRSHTIVECNDTVIDRFTDWRRQYPEREIHLLRGRWQDVVDQMQYYDGILFHTYPLSEQEFVEQVVQSDTFADNFFPVAASRLRERGVFTYFTSEIDSLSRGHQRALWQHFSSFTLTRACNLDIPSDTKDALWANSMVNISVFK